MLGYWSPNWCSDLIETVWFDLWWWVEADSNSDIVHGSNADRKCRYRENRRCVSFSHPFTHQYSSCWNVTTDLFTKRCTENTFRYETSLLPPQKSLCSTIKVLLIDKVFFLNFGVKTNIAARRTINLVKSICNQRWKLKYRAEKDVGRAHVLIGGGIDGVDIFQQLHHVHCVKIRLWAARPRLLLRHLRLG